MKNICGTVNPRFDRLIEGIHEDRKPKVNSTAFVMHWYGKARHEIAILPRSLAPTISTILAYCVFDNPRPLNSSGT